MSDNNEFTVEKILRRTLVHDEVCKNIIIRKINANNINFVIQVQYLIKWKGYSLGESTWEPIVNLLGFCDEFLQDFNLKQAHEVLSNYPIFVIFLFSIKIQKTVEIERNPNVGYVSRLFF